MLNIVFWLLFILVPVFAFLQLKVAGERINHVSLVNITTVALFMFSVVGTLPLFYFLDPYRYNIGVQDKILVLKIIFYSSVNIIFFLLGVIFVRRLLCLQPVKFFSRDIYPLSHLQEQSLVLFFGFCVFVLVVYLSQLDQVAIITALADGASEAKKARSDMGNSFPGKYHWYSLVMHDLGNLITFTFFAKWLTNKNWVALFSFLLTFCYSTFVAVMATEKAPFAWLIIGLFMAYFLVNNNGIVPLRKLIPFSLLLTALLMMFYIYFMGSHDLGSALWSVVSRAFSGSISPAYFYLEFFPDHQNYLLGRTFPNPGGVMPYEPYRYTVEVMNWKFPSLDDSGVVGTAPTVFWGEAYANFGPASIPIVAFAMGSLIATTSYFISKIEINPLSIGFMVWLILKLKDLSVTGFSGFLYSVDIISLILAVIFIFAVRGRFRVKKKVRNISGCSGAHGL